jgi:hypothetical protein
MRQQLQDCAIHLATLRRAFELGTGVGIAFDCEFPPETDGVTGIQNVTEIGISFWPLGASTIQPRNIPYVVAERIGLQWPKSMQEKYDHK